MLVSENTQKILMRLIGDCYKENRYLDRLVSVLSVNFAYTHTSELIHKYIAHYFPKLADLIGETCLERYNIPVYYESTPEAGQNYASVEEIIEELEKHMITFQSTLMGACKIINENNDVHIYVELLEFLEDFNKIVEQAILLKDKIKIYGTRPSFDRHINGFWILKDEEN